MVQQPIDEEDEDSDQHEFVYQQLAHLLFLIDISEEGRRKIMIATINELIFLDGVDERLSDVCGPLMKVLALNAFKNSTELLTYSKELTQEVYNRVVEGDQDALNQSQELPHMRHDPFDPERMKKLELEYARIGVQIEDLRDGIDQCIKEQDFAKAEQLVAKKASLEKERERINKEKFMTEEGAPEGEPMDQSMVSQEPPKVEPNLSDYPDALLKCLQIFTSCLEFGKFIEFDTFIQSHLDKIVSLSIVSNVF